MDVIRCPVSASLNFRGPKLSRMAVEPQKLRKFSTAKIKVHTVIRPGHACAQLVNEALDKIGMGCSQ